MIVYIHMHNETMSCFHVYISKPFHFIRGDVHSTFTSAQKPFNCTHTRAQRILSMKKIIIIIIYLANWTPLNDQTQFEPFRTGWIGWSRFMHYGLRVSWPHCQLDPVVIVIIYLLFGTYLLGRRTPYSFTFDRKLIASGWTFLRMKMYRNCVDVRKTGNKKQTNGTWLVVNSDVGQ